ncbi:MAG: YfjI family protein [Acidobacteriota bacterium]
MLCLAGAVSRRARIQPKEHDTGWIVVPNLWGGIVAPPGFMKSPVLQIATRPLTHLQDQWRKDHTETLAEYTRTKEEHDLRYAAWKEQFKSNTKKGTPAPVRPDDELDEPTVRRLIVNDSTFEKLHETMSENNAGVLVVRDELTGWWSQLDKPGREGERAFCLQAWNGDTGHTIDRIGRGTIHVEACCMSMLGGIQPGRLRSYLIDALHDGPCNDGLIQRFQVLVWPDTKPDWEYVDRTPDPAALEMAERVFHKLIELDPENPPLFRFDPAAQALFVSYLQVLEEKVRGENDLHPALVSHLSKYRSLMPSLALLFGLADRASGLEGDWGDFSNQISLEHAQQAAAFCDYLESHAVRVYSCVTTPQMRAARDLASKIKERKVDGVFTCRKIYLKGWSGLDTVEAVKLASQVLCDAGWVRELETVQELTGGRPTTRYEINPRIWE